MKLLGIFFGFLALSLSSSSFAQAPESLSLVRPMIELIHAPGQAIPGMSQAEAFKFQQWSATLPSFSKAITGGPLFPNLQCQQVPLELELTGKVGEAPKKYSMVSLLNCNGRNWVSRIKSQVGGTCQDFAWTGAMESMVARAFDSYRPANKSPYGSLDMAPVDLSEVGNERLNTNWNGVRAPLQGSQFGMVVEAAFTSSMDRTADDLKIYPEAVRGYAKLLAPYSDVCAKLVNYNFPGGPQMKLDAAGKMTDFSDIRACFLDAYQKRDLLTVSVQNPQAIDVKFCRKKSGSAWSSVACPSETFGGPDSALQVDFAKSEEGIFAAIAAGFPVLVGGSWLWDGKSSYNAPVSGTPYVFRRVTPAPLESYLDDKLQCKDCLDRIKDGKPYNFGNAAAHAFQIIGFLKGVDNPSEGYFILKNSHGDYTDGSEFNPSQMIFQLAELPSHFSSAFDDKSTQRNFFVWNSKGTLGTIFTVPTSLAFSSSNGVDDPKKYSYTDSIATRDTDGDGVIDFFDNCPFAPNPTQADSDGDGVGDACDRLPKLYDRFQRRSYVEFHPNDLNSNGVPDIWETLNQVGSTVVEFSPVTLGKFSKDRSLTGVMTRKIPYSLSTFSRSGAFVVQPNFSLLPVNQLGPRSVSQVPDRIYSLLHQYGALGAWVSFPVNLKDGEQGSVQYEKAAGQFSLPDPKDATKSVEVDFTKLEPSFLEVQFLHGIGRFFPDWAFPGTRSVQIYVRQLILGLFPPNLSSTGSVFIPEKESGAFSAPTALAADSNLSNSEEGQIGPYRHYVDLDGDGYVERIDMSYWNLVIKKFLRTGANQVAVTKTSLNALNSEKYPSTYRIAGSWKPKGPSGPTWVVLFSDLNKRLLIVSLTHLAPFQLSQVLALDLDKEIKSSAWYKMMALAPTGSAVAGGKISISIGLAFEFKPGVHFDYTGMLMGDLDKTGTLSLLITGESGGIGIRVKQDASWSWVKEGVMSELTRHPYDDTIATADLDGDGTDEIVHLDQYGHFEILSLTPSGEFVVQREGSPSEVIGGIRLSLGASSMHIVRGPQKDYVLFDVK